ncbi:MAG: hypothetical protein FJ087_09025 [Deltaproteobacteria bacterium]|nr:hypothetical protein [Deltaproteobacteria bacterium]
MAGTDTRPAGVLGVWDGHDASACLVADGEVVFALSEERPTRRKRFSGFPHRSIRAALAFAEAHGVEVRDVAVAGRHGRALQRLLDPLYSRGDPARDPTSAASLLVAAWENTVPRLPIAREVERAAGSAPLMARLRAAVGAPFRLHLVPHHEAHAFSALLGGGGPDALVVTFDAYGEGVAATARSAADPARPVATLPPSAGLARLYGAATVRLGFREGDEGKVMGLAARGDPEPGLGRLLAMFAARGGEPALRVPVTRATVDKALAGLSREDASAAVQAVTESLAAAWVASVLPRVPGATRLLLAGGLFSNILLNRALAALPGVGCVFVFPNMVDGGLRAGAAHRAWRDIAGACCRPIRHVLLGREFGAGDARRAAEASGLPWRRADDPEAAAVAHLLAGRVVCRHDGRDEFGPRALGNRSVLFPAADPALADRVNAALARDEFMPFGPALPSDHPPGLWTGRARDEDLRYMTLAVAATDAFRRACPAVVHLDGTARPQVADPVWCAGLDRILRGYAAGGGGPAVVNTSFNLHGEPIVHTPEDAVRTFAASGLDVLLVGGIEVRRA